jgi:uncharacterized membrane protein
MMPRKVERVVFLVLAFVMFAFGFAIMLWPRLSAGVSDCVFLSAMSALLIFLGAYQLGIKRERADAISEELAKSPLRRLGLPVRFYTSKIVFWQFRLLSVILIALGVMTAYAAVLAHRRGL